MTAASIPFLCLAAVARLVMVGAQETNCSLDTAELAVLGTGGAVLHLHLPASVLI